MTEFIEREAAIVAIAHRPHVKGWDDYEDGLCRGLEEAVNAICSIHVADVRPVVRGRWKPVMCAGNPNIQDRDELYGALFVCDKCNQTMIGKSNYCPNCGADMREV